MARSACAAFGGCCSARTSWFPCVLLCVLLGLVSLPCVGRPCAQLFCCMRSSQFRALFLLASSLLLVCGATGVACRSLHPIVAVGLSHSQLGGARGTRHFCTCLQIYKLTCRLCLLGLFRGECVALLLFCFFFVPTLVSSAIKADSVLRQQWPRGMYSKVSLATWLDAGEAVLHRGRAQWGHKTCMYCTLHAGGGACHDHRGSTPRKTAKLRLHQNQRATNHQERTIRTYRGPLVQNRKTHTPGWKVRQAERLLLFCFLGC